MADRLAENTKNPGELAIVGCETRTKLWTRAR